MKKVIVILCVIVAVALIAHKAGYDEGYEVGLSEPKPLSRPYSGTILSGREYSGSELTIHADTDEDYVVSLKDSWGDVYVAFYVRAGETVTVGVPANCLYAYFACGDHWYGYGKGLMFGKGTSYSRDEEELDFTQYTYEYTLYPVNDGNFSETPSNENEFF